MADLAEIVRNTPVLITIEGDAGVFLGGLASRLNRKWISRGKGVGWGSITFSFGTVLAGTFPEGTRNSILGGLAYVTGHSAGYFVDWFFHLPAINEAVRKNWERYRFYVLKAAFSPKGYLLHPDVRERYSDLEYAFHHYIRVRFNPVELLRYCFVADHLQDDDPYRAMLMMYQENIGPAKDLVEMVNEARRSHQLAPLKPWACDFGITYPRRGGYRQTIARFEEALPEVQAIQTSSS